MNAQTVGHVNSVCQVTTVYRGFYQLTAAARFQCTSTEQIKVFSRTELSNLLARPVTLGLANVPSGRTLRFLFGDGNSRYSTSYSAARILTRLRVSGSGIQISAEQKRFSLRIIYTGSGFQLASNTVKS